MAATGAWAPSVVACVLNYKLPDVTAQCVASLLASDYGHLHIVIIDNGSRDGSAEALRARFPQVAILESDRNLFFAGGMNLGLRHALAIGADYALAMNNDTLVAPDMVRRLVEAAETLSQAGIVAPVIRRPDGRLWAAGSRERRLWPFPQDIARSKMDLSGQPFRVDYVTGCGMLIRRDVLEAIGLFDEDYAMYYEDADFCARARRAGYTIWVEPSAEMIHLVSASAKRQAPQSAYAHTRYRVRFYREHRHPLWRAGLGLLALQEGARAVKEGLAGQSEVALARLRGLRDGFGDDLAREGTEG